MVIFFRKWHADFWLERSPGMATSLWSRSSVRTSRGSGAHPTHTPPPFSAKRAVTNMLSLCMPLCLLCYFPSFILGGDKRQACPIPPSHPQGTPRLRPAWWPTTRNKFVTEYRGCDEVWFHSPLQVWWRIKPLTEVWTQWVLTQQVPLEASFGLGLLSPPRPWVNGSTGLGDSLAEAIVLPCRVSENGEICVFSYVNVNNVQRERERENNKALRVSCILHMCLWAHVCAGVCVGAEGQCGEGSRRTGVIEGHKILLQKVIIKNRCV